MYLGRIIHSKIELCHSLRAVPLQHLNPTIVVNCTIYSKKALTKPMATSSFLDVLLYLLHINSDESCPVERVS